MSSKKYRGYFNYTTRIGKKFNCYNFKDLSEKQVLELAKKFMNKEKYIYHGHKVNIQFNGEHKIDKKLNEQI